MTWLVIHLLELVIRFFGVHACLCTGTLDNRRKESGSRGSSSSIEVSIRFSGVHACLCTGTLDYLRKESGSRGSPFIYLSWLLVFPIFMLVCALAH